ncbi:MAG: hypothetical protein DLM64_01160 [Solirubrobacterales bacterium]|nr:MAG: hypothetical protein DLM64_01160 [Solirubrobacterales bacterium]
MGRLERDVTALVSVETVLLVLLVVLVAGLLRSHAEILRRLGSSADQEGVGSPVAPPPAAPRTGGELRPAPLAGTTPDGDVVTLALDGPGAAPTLLAFLTSGCSTCASFWEALGERGLPPGVRTVIVTHGSDRERPARLRSLAPAGIPVVMSSRAWKDYGVPGAPYFVLVDGAVRGEGVATTWQALASLVGDAIEDRRQAQDTGSGAERARRVQETLAAAGIGPEHPSLYPGGRTGSE